MNYELNLTTESFKRALYHKPCGSFHPTYPFETFNHIPVPVNPDEFCELPCLERINGFAFEDRISKPDGYKGARLIYILIDISQSLL